MTNDKLSVPKEFWLFAHHTDPEKLIYIMDTPCSGYGLHVIEYSAFEVIKNESLEINGALLNENTALQEDRDFYKREFEYAVERCHRLKEIISYIPKVPTEPYEKNMAKEIDRLSKTLLGFGARNNKLREALVIAEDAIHSEYCGNDGCHAIHKEIEALEKGEE